MTATSERGAARRRAAALLLLWACAAPAGEREQAQAEEQLRRATEAAMSLNYDGTFVYRGRRAR